MSKLSDWDIDFQRGVYGENLVKDLVETVEVKTDYRWQETGNVYIEYSCFYKTSQQFENSGIAVTKAKYWALVLPNKQAEPLIILVHTEHLKEALKKYGRRTECIISQNKSKGLLIKIEDILKHIKEKYGENI